MAERDFKPFLKATFADKAKTLEYYENGLKSLLSFAKLSSQPLDTITQQTISGFIAKRRAAGLKVSSINRELQVLRRMFKLANEWGNVEKALPAVRMLPGENHRDRVVTKEQETKYLLAAPPLLHDVASVLIDCGLRPEECFRLRWENVIDGAIHIDFGKTKAARRQIQMPKRVAKIMARRRDEVDSEWVFPAPT